MVSFGKNTNSSQFYITLAALPWLDGLQVVFGKFSKLNSVILNDTLSQVKLTTKQAWKPSEKSKLWARMMEVFKSKESRYMNLPYNAIIIHLPNRVFLNIDTLMQRTFRRPRLSSMKHMDLSPFVDHHTTDLQDTRNKYKGYRTGKPSFQNFL
jgi:hypothetical protein